MPWLSKPGSQLHPLYKWLTSSGGGQALVYKPVGFFECTGNDHQKPRGVILLRQEGQSSLIAAPGIARCPCTVHDCYLLPI